MFLDTFKGDSRQLQGYLKEVQRVFRESFKEGSRVFKESVKCVSRKFQRCFMNVLIKFLRFFCCMDLIAATRAEGGLVLLNLVCLNYILCPIFKALQHLQTMKITQNSLKFLATFYLIAHLYLFIGCSLANVIRSKFIPVHLYRRKPLPVNAVF